MCSACPGLALDFLRAWQSFELWDAPSFSFPWEFFLLPPSAPFFPVARGKAEQTGLAAFMCQGPRRGDLHMHACRARGMDSVRPPSHPGWGGGCCAALLLSVAILCCMIQTAALVATRSCQAITRPGTVTQVQRTGCSVDKDGWLAVTPLTGQHGLCFLQQR